MRKQRNERHLSDPCKLLALTATLIMLGSVAVRASTTTPGKWNASTSPPWIPIPNAVTHKSRICTPPC